MPTRGTIRQAARSVAMLGALICMAASCEPRTTVTGARCGFANPVFMTETWICTLAAEYYVANHKWPVSRAQLEKQNNALLEKQRTELSPDEVKEASEFFKRFTLVEMTDQEGRLVLHYQFKMDRKNVDRTVTFAPGPTVDEILRAATAEPLPD